MNRRDFLSGIEKGLAGLPREDVESRLAFYSEMIDDRVEDGLRGRSRCRGRVSR